MKRRIFLLSVYALSLVAMLAFTGCSGGSGGVGFNPAASDNSSSPASGANGSVTFQIITPESNASIVTPSIRRSTDSAPSVTFKLHLINIGNQSTPTSSMIKTVPVDLDTGTAEVTFNNVPACTCIGEVIITGGNINNQTEFHGAIDLAPGANNILQAAAKGSKLSQDVVASVLKEIVDSPILFAQALPNLALEVADAISSLDMTSDDIYREALALYAKYVDVDINIISEPLAPPDVITFNATTTADVNSSAGLSVELELNIPDTYNQVAKVEFFAGASDKLAEFVDPPFKYTTLYNAANATYTALVIYQSGAMKTLKTSVVVAALPPTTEDQVLKANYPTVSSAYADLRATLLDNSADIDSRMATFSSYFAADFVDMSGTASKTDLETVMKSFLERYNINSYELTPISHIEEVAAGAVATDTIKITTRIFLSMTRKPGAAGAVESGTFPISPDPVIIWKLQPDNSWKIYQGFPYKTSEIGF